MAQYIDINIENLQFWGENPRYGLTDEIHDTPQKAISDLIKMNINHFKKLSRDISLNGLLPNDLPVVVKISGDMYKVYEGNRRLASLRSIHNPELITDNDEVKEYIKRLKTDKITKKVKCCLVDSIGEAFDIVEKLHLGENGGAGRIKWKSLNKQSFQALKAKIDKQNPSKKVKADKVGSPSYVLYTKYPETFADVINRVKSTNIDRLLTYVKLKELIGTTNYSDLSPLQIELVKFSIDKVVDLSGSDSISRFISTVDKTDETLIPLISQEKERLETLDKKMKAMETIQSLPEIKLRTDRIVVDSNNSYNLNTNILNQSEFDSLKILAIGDPLLVINEMNIVSSANIPGNYTVRYSGFKKGLEIHSVTVEIVIRDISTKLPIIVKPRARPLFEDESGHQIQIGWTIDEIISEIQSLNFHNYYALITPSIRLLIEESIKILFARKSWPFTAGRLEDKIEALKTNLLGDNALLNRIDVTLAMGYHQLTNFLSNIDSSSIAQKLNIMTHTSKAFVPFSEILSLIDTIITRLLVIISIALKV